jgi:DnaK suppressor protein
MESLQFDDSEWTDFSDENKEYFKKILTQMLDESFQDDKTVNDIDNPLERLPDPSDRATMELVSGYNHTLRERKKGLIRKIDQALVRLENGTYGICEECEEEISVERLKVRPVTTLCIECKRNEEKLENI